jgi:hypothetical protein
MPVARAPWHPYGPDQAFGREAARDEELLDQTIASLQKAHRHSPRAGCKAEPPGAAGAGPTPAGVRLAGWLNSDAGLPVTTNVGLEAAARLRSDPD